MVYFTTILVNLFAGTLQNVINYEFMIRLVNGRYIKYCRIQYNNNSVINRYMNRANKDIE